MILFVSVNCGGVNFKSSYRFAESYISEILLIIIVGFSIFFFLTNQLSIPAILLLYIVILILSFLILKFLGMDKSKNSKRSTNNKSSYNKLPPKKQKNKFKK